MDRRLELRLRKRVASRVLIREMSQNVTRPGADGGRIPVKVLVDVGIIRFAVLALLDSQKTGNFVTAQDGGDIQEGPEVCFRNQDVVFGIDEQIILIFSLRAQFLVREGQ